MVKKRTNADGAAMVIKTVQDHWHQKHNSYHGAMQWLAAGLGITRQTLDNYRKRGEFPERYVAKICELFPKLKPSDIRPEDSPLKSNRKS